LKAVIHTKYGKADEVLTLGEIDRPTIKDDEVLVRVRAASVHADIWHTVVGRPYILRLFGNGLVKPKRRVPGTDLAGIVESIGKNVTRLKIGDPVFGESVKFGWYNGGAYAEYAAVPEAFLVTKPDNITFEQAAAVPSAGVIALNNVRSTNKTGQNLLINGAGGAMGMLAIQIAKAQGARVTAVDCAEKLQLMRSLGADRVIDYAREDYLQGSERYDVILDVASILPQTKYKHVLTPTGRYTPIGHAHYGKASHFNGRLFGSMPYFVGLLLRALLDPKQRKQIRIRSKLEIMNELRALLEAGALTPVVGKTYSLRDVTTAMAELEEGRTVGRLIITP
jgi:NADPH:quinone reductase-like Zn-dependent oxidoreductase